ncbi:MAG: hypothetical protein U0559_07430 [Anaerolineae bacterium]
MKNRKLGRSVIVSVLVVGVALAAIWAALPVTIASAAELNQGGVALENLLKREQIVLNNQQERLTLSQQAVEKAQQWLADLQAEGKDVAALQAALSAFQNGLAQAQTSFNTAKQALDAHAGFDASGKVTNAAQALKTLVDAGRAERQFHLTITQATLDFRAAVRAYLQANK